MQIAPSRGYSVAAPPPGGQNRVWAWGLVRWAGPRSVGGARVQRGSSRKVCAATRSGLARRTSQPPSPNRGELDHNR